MRRQPMTSPAPRDAAASASPPRVRVEESVPPHMRAAVERVWSVLMQPRASRTEADVAAVAHTLTHTLGLEFFRSLPKELVEVRGRRGRGGGGVKRRLAREAHLKHTHPALAQILCRDMRPQRAQSNRVLFYQGEPASCVRARAPAGRPFAPNKRIILHTRTPKPSLTPPARMRGPGTCTWSCAVL